MSKRFIKVARKFFEGDEWLTPRTFSDAEAWLDMIFLACFADHTIDLGKDGILTLQRGEFYYTQRQLAKRWSWPLSRVNRYLARLAEGDNPRIVKVQRETQNETHIETQVETQITVIRLCNYDSYNKADAKTETHIETHIETQNETLNKKGYNKKGNNNTHTSYLTLRDLFVQACMCNTREAHERASRTAEEMALLTQADQEASKEHYKRCTNDPSYNLIFWLWWKHSDLQLSFQQPLRPSEAQDLLRRYKLDDIGNLVEDIINKRDSITGKSLYYTIKNFARHDNTLRPQ